MKKINCEIIQPNISEAREQLSNLEKQIKSKKKPNIAEFQIALQHAYHHLNFAWKIRHKTTSWYNKMTNKEFRKYGKYPKDMDKFDME